MKKLKILISSTFSFLALANNSFATSEVASQINSENSGTMNDLGPFIIGAILIICVLFIGYKMDKSSENMPTMKKQKNTNKHKKVEKSKINTQDKKDSKLYDQENKFDIPYEADENDYYENDKNFDFDNLNDDMEYEEDDVSLFNHEKDDELTFDDIDDDISYKFDELDESDVDKNSLDESFDSTMVFNSKEINNEGLKKDYIEDDLDEKIDNLDDDLPDLLNRDEQDAQDFINEINKYKESSEAENFSDFSTKSKSKKTLKEKETKNELENTVDKDSEINQAYNNMNNDFLNQMEQNLKKDQEERMKKSKTDNNKKN